MADVTAALPPIPGRALDPPPKPTPERVARLASDGGALGTGVGVGYLAFLRYSRAQIPLLAAGTTYYLFLAMLSIIAFAYGLTAALGADQIANYLTEALGEAFPGLIGDDGIDPQALAATGRSTSIVGAIGLLYAGSGGTLAAQRSVHAVFGAPDDPRNYVLKRIRSLGWLIVLGPLILLSFVTSSFLTNVSDRVLDVFGVDWQGPDILVRLLAVAGSFALDFLVVYLILGHFGGIRPARRPRVIGAAVGAVVIEALKVLMALLLSFTIDKPQYGAFAAPIGVMFVLYLQSNALYGVAALTAGIAEATHDEGLPEALAAPTDDDTEAADTTAAETDAALPATATGDAEEGR